MFKKLKDKLAEEVKSSPQRIQQFAQAAQAAVTSASSSISDITNSDLFSIGDNDNHSNQTSKPSTSNTQSFQEVTLSHSAQFSGPETVDFLSGHEIMDNQRQRRLSNSSFASDVSFRLPSYESPSMYHLQSDMEVSASEAEERGISLGSVNLDRVTKEQLHAAYRRTKDKYTKYRTQYADLARHYKLLERENAKARSVLVETQDKALRRISELREQCTLEQSAKAHLEKALRVEIEEKNMKIDALSTKVSLLQNNYHIDTDTNKSASHNKDAKETEYDVQLVNLSTENDVKPHEVKVQEVESTPNDLILNSKIEKMEQLLNKYKESLKSIKEKNSQMTTELQILSSELENKNKENEQLKANVNQISEAHKKIQELNILNEELQNKINTYDFSKSKEISALEIDLQKSQEEIAELRSMIGVFSKREEENAISLAENKLSIHKELESKEAEIKTLKSNLSVIEKELQTLSLTVNDYKITIANLEEERLKLNNEINETNLNKSKIMDMETQIQSLTQKCQLHEQVKTKRDEELKCLQLQMNQETAEKLAMKDRHTYLENRISQLTEENSKKSEHINHLENELETRIEKDLGSKEKSNEVELWKSKYTILESEIQEEREELIKLQTEIEKLLANHESVQNENCELQRISAILQSENKCLYQKRDHIKSKAKQLVSEVQVIKENMKSIFDVVNPFKEEIINTMIPDIKSKLVELNDISNVHNNVKVQNEKLQKDYLMLQTEFMNMSNEYKKYSQEIGTLKDENKNQESKIVLLQEKIKSLTDNFAHSTDEANLLKNEKDKFLNKIHDLETLCNHLQNSVDHDKSQYLTALDKLKLLEDEKQTLQKRLNKLEKENELLNIEVEKLKLLHKDDTSRLDTMNEEKQTISNEIKEKESMIQKLEQTTQVLRQENISLHNQSESIANSVKALELEIEEVRKSHADIGVEKDRLNSIIEILENKELERIAVSLENSKDTQTESQAQNIENDLKSTSAAFLEKSNSERPKNNDDILSLLNSVEVLSSKNSEYEEEIKSLKEYNITLANKLMELNNTSKNNNNEKVEEDVTDKYRALCNDHDVVKEDNRRLQSDIEGLQTYLTKISKENGVLNDKLRESIATSENSFGKSEFYSADNNSFDLKNEVISGKEKIDNLIRENALLVEENLELKDQLQSHNYVEPKKSNNEKDTVALEKYNDLLMNKSRLEDKITELDQMNKSQNGNMQHMQNNYEKLRLTNEKLERRLDEALVSLRHLHALQENTELEYLRNILYEYLTGSGTHSITLAKVLAAVVKFDDQQTHNILQKEKERQGILRQLGLL